MRGRRATLGRRAELLGALGLGLGAVLAFGSSCANTTLTTPITVAQTSIWVDPAIFLGNVPCSSLPGGMRSYVATLVDLGPGGGTGAGGAAATTLSPPPFPLPSSRPTACSEPVAFQFVNVGHLYVASLDGYEELPDELVPEGALPGSAGNPDSGSRHMLHAAGAAQAGARATPRWTTACGEAGAACESPSYPPTCAIAQFETDVFVGACAPLTDSGKQRPAVVLLDPRSAFGATACNTITSFRVTPADASIGAAIDRPCDAAPLTYQAIGGMAYTFRVDALDRVGKIRAATTCTAVATEGLTKTVACDPPSADGAMSIPFATLLAASGKSCPGALVGYTVEATATVGAGSGGTTLQGGPFACDATAQIAPLAPGNALATVKGLDATGKTALTAICHAFVQPGRVQPATCSISP